MTLFWSVIHSQILQFAKVRPAVVVSSPHQSQDLIIVPLTSKLAGLLPGEFQLANWPDAGLNVPSASKRGLYTIHSSLIVKRIGRLSSDDSNHLEMSIKSWLGIR